MYISTTLFCMRPSAGNGRYPQTAKCSRSVPGKNCIPLCSRTVIIAEARLADTETEYCQNCRKHRSFVAEGRSLFVYRGAVQKSMYRFKYANRRRYARFLAEEAMQRWENWMREKRIEAIVPVPMYSKKERYRGYNQAALFGRALSEKMDIPCIPRLMIRVKDTRPQKELNGRERENNVKNAFQSSDNVVKYKRILIVDDIYTTGSTVEAVAES